MIAIAVTLALHCAPVLHRTSVVLGAPISTQLGRCQLPDLDLGPQPPKRHAWTT